MKGSSSMMGLRGRAGAVGFCFSALLLLATLVAASARADEAPAAPSAGQESAEQGPPLPWRVGPAPVELGHGVRLDLPAGYQFLGMPEAGQQLEKMGNLHNENLLGVVISSTPGDDYFVTLRYDEEGYIKDDEELDGKELLKTIKEGEEEYNEERKKLGFEAIHAAGWLEDPRYDKAVHHLVWALIVTDSQGESINYNTRILGRKGYASVNLVTDRKNLARDKPAAAALLHVTAFEPGARYENFDESKGDKVAEYGLAGLVLGGAGLGLLKVAKIGLLAKFGKVFLAALIVGKKAIAALVIAAVAFVKKLFSRKSKAPDAA
jgi:uncharacterized membrane-anchored protein